MIVTIPLVVSLVLLAVILLVLVIRYIKKDEQFTYIDGRSVWRASDNETVLKWKNGGSLRGKLSFSSEGGALRLYDGIEVVWSSYEKTKRPATEMIFDSNNGQLTFKNANGEVLWLVNPVSDNDIAVLKKPFDLIRLGGEKIGDKLDFGIRDKDNNLIWSARGD